VQYGRRAGAIAALILSGCDFLLRGEAITVALNGLVLLLLAAWSSATWPGSPPRWRPNAST
jgi:hypothetical protein